MRFIVCNAGSVAASNYMTDFLKELNNYGMKIPEAVAYRTEVYTTHTLGGRFSTVTNYPEETRWHFEEQGIKYKSVTKDLYKNGKIRYSTKKEDKNKIRMLFTFDSNGQVKRTPLEKTAEQQNRKRKVNSNIDIQNDHEDFKQNLDNDFKDCYSRKRRRKRNPSVCSWIVDDVEKEYVIKENTLTIHEGEVQVELVNRNNPEDTHLVSFPLDESCYMKQVKETAKEAVSLAKTGMTQTLEDINKAMGIYGIIAGLIDAGKFFAENDTTRGGFTLSQSLHGLGEMTGLDQQITRMSRNIFQKVLHQAAEEMGMEKVLAKASSSLERFGKSTAGQFLKDIPIVGLGFQGYFIAEGAIAIHESNRSDPNQNKYFGLKVTNLVLDVSTTVLTIAEVAFPPAAIILEPIVIGLTIVRMSIGDFYCDIVSELDKLPQGASDFDKMIAVIVGLEEDAVDFVTGGLLREIDALDKEEKQNKELLRNLSTPESYYRITANDGGNSTLDLMDGILSQYGGFVTVQLLNDGNVKIQVGGVDDGQGEFKTIEK